MPESLEVLLYRVSMMEKDFAQLKMQLTAYEPVKENTLKLQHMQEIIARLETELTGMKSRVEDMGKEQEQARLEQEKAHVKILWTAISITLGVGLSILTAYITHYF